MAIWPEAQELENQSVGAHGLPTLGPAYVLLREQWSSGERERELALHLMFLAWYLVVEPSHLTGFDEADGVSSDFAVVFNEVHDWLLPAGAASDDAEALYAAGLPASMFPWALGDERTWAERAVAYRQRYRQLAPHGLSPEVFERRGAYGEYFGGQARVEGGF